MPSETRIHDGSPRSLGYRMPAEWEPHSATWIAWPHNAEDWPGKFHPIPWVYCEIVRQLSRVEVVHILVNDSAAEKRVRGLLSKAGANLDWVRFHSWPTNRVWLRDSGPIFVTKVSEDSPPAEPHAGSRLALTDWRFNAWAKYDNWQLDDELPSKVAEFLKVRAWTPHFSEPKEPAQRAVLEGGSIDVNGAGTLITTEECLLSKVQQRNPGQDRQSLEHIFHDNLNIDQVLWMRRGIAGDDTHGHVDDIVRFVSHNTILAAVEPNTADENHLPLAENLDILKTARNLKGEPFRVVELPMPEPVVFEDQRLPASYANFYIANNLVLVPTFNDANDRRALQVLAELFPDRRVVGIHADDLVWGLGTLHCMTQQQPAVHP